MPTPPPGSRAVKRRPYKARVRDAYGKRIQALYERGHKPSVIARRLGLNPDTVRKILAYAGLLHPRGTHPVREKILPLVQQGLTFKEAAKVLGVSPKVARCHHRQAGGKAARSDSTWPGSPRRAAELLERLGAYRQRTSITWKELAARCGSSARLFSEWHTGKRVPSNYTLNKIEGFLSGEPTA